MAEKKRSTIDFIEAVKESQEKRDSYISFAISLLAVILLAVFAISPTISTIVKINKEIKEKNRTTALLQNKINSLSSLDAQYKESKAKFDLLTLIYPANSNYSLLLSNIDSIVSRDGFTLTSISFNEYEGEIYDISTMAIKPKSIRMNIRGQQTNLINLLKDLESLPMYPVIETVSFSSQKDETGQLVFNIALRVYGIDRTNFYE